MNYTFDAGNRLRTAVDSISGTITRAYDDLNRLTSEGTPQGSVSYTYDNAGRRASLTVPGQAVANYTFDNANRLTQITQGTTTVSFGYDNANRRTTLTLPNGVVTSYSYDGASQLAGLTYSLGQTTLGNLSYAYDNVGRRNSVGGSYARTGLPNAVSQTAYNANNQLTTWGTANLFYDLNGNMTSSGTDGFTWDARNRMVSTLSGASFQYDAFGRRTSKTIGSTTTSFLYDGANPVQELSGTTVSANSLSGGIDEVFQRTDSAGARSFLTDALGSTLALTDSTGTTQTSYTFEPFGNTSASGSATTNSFAYTGRELDGTGLYFYRARYYNPVLQRFISEDPLKYGGSGPNLYAYVANSPADFSDPLGLATCDQTCKTQIATLQDLFPGSSYDKTTNTMTIPQDYQTVLQTLQNGGYQEPPEVWTWNPFIYWDPIFHSGAEEFRLSVDNSSFHFGAKYPASPICDPLFGCISPPGPGRQEDQARRFSHRSARPAV